MDPSTRRSYKLGARLAGLLINVGADCLRPIFEDGIMKKFSLPLENGSNVKGKKRVIYKEQWQLLYPDLNEEVDLHTFDLTLLTLLIRILDLIEAPIGGWFCEPPDNDNSQAANILRLRTLRNQLYGHISTTACSNNEFKTTFNKLEKVLLSLGGDPATIAVWKTKFGNEDEQGDQDMKMICNQLKNLLQADLHDIQTLQKNLLEIVETLTSGSATEQHRSLVSILDELRSDVADSLPNKVLETFNILQRTLKSEFEAISMKFTDLINNKDDSLKNILFEIRRQLRDSSQVQVQISKNVKSILDSQQEVQDKLDNLDRLVYELQHEQKPRENSEALLPGLLFDDNDWKKIKDPFRILIITSVSQLTLNELLFERLGGAVGLCPWHVVIDLDQRSQSSDGMYDYINETLRKHTVTQVETYMSVRTTREQDKEAVVKSEKVLWIQANGSETLNCEPCLDHFGRSTSKIQVVLEDMLMRFPVKRPILCVAVILSDVPKELSAVKEIGRMIERIYDCQMEKIDIDESKFCVFADQDTIHSNIAEIPGNSRYMEWKRYCESLTRFSDFFFQMYGRQLEIKYNIPSFGESIGLSEEEYVQLKTVMELYHTDVGKLNLDAMSEQDYSTKVNEIKYRFLKGNVISPEALYLHERGEKMYVDRSEMKDIKLWIQKELQIRHKLSTTNASRKGICLIEHDTSGGGTTCGRHLLFSLRHEYPCIEIKQFGQQLLEWLKIIYCKTQVPLLLLIDNLDCQTSDAITLERFLENKRVKALLIHLKRKVKRRMPSGDGNRQAEWSHERTIDIQFELNSQVVSTPDKIAFKKLYETNQQKAFTLKVFMFGLCKFLQEYEKLDPLIENCISTAKENQLKLMRVILYTSKYVHYGVSLEVAVKLLDDTSENIEKSLGSIADFLVCENTRLRIANDCLIEPFLRKFDPPDSGTQLGQFLEDILAYSLKDSDEKRNSFELIGSFFIRSRKIDHQWTEFIEDLEKTQGQCFVTKMTVQFLNIFDGVATGCPHLRTFYARYLMHQVNDHKLAIDQIRIALSISETDGICKTSVTDMVLLSAYGHLHRDVMKHKIKEEIAKYKKTQDKMQLDEIFHFASEAVQAYETAQHSTKTSLYDMKEMFSGASFYFEAHTRFMLLSHIHTYKCCGNYEIFAKYLSENKQILLVKESLPKALLTIQKLEYLMEVGRVDIDAETTQKVTRTKFDLLQLLTDEKLSMKHTLSRMPDKFPCDFGYFVLNYCAKTRAPRQWKDLPFMDLKFIIDRISARIQNPEVMLRANYRDVIRAMIFSRQLRYNNVLKYNLKWACECATEWVRHHSKDFEAHFMLGFLRLLEAVAADDIETLNAAKKSLETCKKLCKENPSMPAYCHFRYNIGCGDGLGRAIPYDKAIAKPLLMEFFGRKKDANCIALRLGRFENALTVNVLKSEHPGTDEDSWSVIQNQRFITFNLAIALERISASNVSICDRKDSPAYLSD